jgi:uncharacterized protein YyaL (SSP411 family)
MRPLKISLGVWISLIAGTCAARVKGDAVDSATLAKWGGETLAKVDSAFYMPERGLYALEAGAGVKRQRPAWVWDASIQLGALCAAARMEPKTYLPRVKAYAAGLRTYRTTYHDRPGLDVNPPPKAPDRYYDDNAWICLSLLEAYELTGDAKDLALAMDAYNFLMSGEDSSTLGGGIYWHEDQTRTKNACSSGPAMVASLKLYELTGEQKYLETTKRLYAWTRAHLQDEDGLVFDSIATADGAINRQKFTYNSATLIRAACGLYLASGEKAYLEEAQRVARAAELRFVRQRDGVIGGAGKLGVKLVETFLAMYEVDGDEHWKAVVGRCLGALRQKRDAEGWYAQGWQRAEAGANGPVRLIDQAAPARAYWVAAEHGVEVR